MTKQGEEHPLQAHEGRQGSATRTTSWEKLSYLMRNQLVGAPLWNAFTLMHACSMKQEQEESKACVQVQVHDLAQTWWDSSHSQRAATAWTQVDTGTAARTGGGEGCGVIQLFVRH